MPDTVSRAWATERDAGSLVEAGHSSRGQPHKGGTLSQESEAQRKELVPPRAPLEALPWPRGSLYKNVRSWSDREGYGREEWTSTSVR